MTNIPHYIPMIRKMFHDESPKWQQKRRHPICLLQIVVVPFGSPAKQRRWLAMAKRAAVVFCFFQRGCEMGEVITSKVVPYIRVYHI